MQTKANYNHTEEFNAFLSADREDCTWTTSWCYAWLTWWAEEHCEAQQGEFVASIHRLDYWLFSPASLQTRPLFAESGATIGHPRTKALQTLTWSR